MKEALELVKATFEVTKQLLLVAVLVCLIFFPSVVGATLDKIGITEGDLWGLKWKSRFVATDERLLQANAANEEFKRQLQQANVTIEEQATLIQQLQNRTGGPGNAEEQRAATAIVDGARQVVEQNNTAITAATRVIEAAGQTIAANTPLVARAEQAGSTSSEWGIVAGSDPTLTGAQDDLRRAQRATLPARLFKRLNYYRTVVIYPDRQKAVSALEAVKDKMARPDAYVVDLQRWCASRRPVSSDLVECVPGS
jgi:hypothetical protein